MATPLNPALYGALHARFGSVKFSNEGNRFLSRVAKHLESGKDVEQVIDPGEYYRVCCPYCGDKRYRLYINHRWNTIRDNGQRYGRHLAVCFNEHCDLRNLDEELKIYVNYKAKLHRPEDAPFQNPDNLFSEVTLPGVCVKLSSLDKQHPAIKYIEGRNFDYRDLENNWGVVYCDHTDRDRDGFIPKTKIHAGLVQSRLIVPIYRLSTLVGWQARATNDKEEPKYYTMPGLNKNMMLFNGDRAKEYKFGVVVEGVFDAFRVGPRAVALLGKHMSVHQRNLAHAYWAQGALCIMLDPDAIADMQCLQQLVNSQLFRWGVFPVVLPDNNDPAEMPTKELWDVISNTARAYNVPLSSFMRQTSHLLIR